MHLARIQSFALIGALAAAAGCKKQETTSTAPPEGSGSSELAGGSNAGSGPATVAAGSGSAAPVVTAPPRGPRGRAAADSKPELVELATANETCKLDVRYPKNSCNDQVKAFVAVFDPATDLPTLINLLEDPSPQVRFLGARVLADKMLLQTAPARAYAARITAAATAETEPTTAGIYGPSLLQGDFADPTYADAIGVLFESHPLAEMRASIASNLAVQGPSWLPRMIARFGAETDKAVKVAIVSGTYLARDAATVCPFLLEVMKDPDNDLAGAAGYGLVWSDGKCKDHYDAFLDAYAAHLARTTADFAFVLKIAYMAKAKGATDAQKARFLEDSKAIVSDPKVSGMARAKMLETIGDKAYAKRFVADPDSSLAAAAKKLAK